MNDRKEKLRMQSENEKKNDKESVRVAHHK